MTWVLNSVSTATTINGCLLNEYACQNDGTLPPETAPAGDEFAALNLTATDDLKATATSANEIDEENLAVGVGTWESSSSSGGTATPVLTGNYLVFGNGTYALELLPGKPTVMPMVAVVLAGNDQLELYDAVTQNLVLWINLTP
jgi:hypothetical protein